MMENKRGRGSGRRAQNRMRSTTQGTLHKREGMQAAGSVQSSSLQKTAGRDERAQCEFGTHVLQQVGSCVSGMMEHPCRRGMRRTCPPDEVEVHEVVVAVVRAPSIRNLTAMPTRSMGVQETILRPPNTTTTTTTSTPLKSHPPDSRHKRHSLPEALQSLTSES